MNTLLGIRIANLRKQKGISAKELAEGIISISYLSNIEKGKKYRVLRPFYFYQSV
ncbi:helix-turn-helix domain-containing protein [Carnobacterium gallinarum]